MPTTGSHPRSLVSLDYSQYHRYYHLSSWSSLAPRRARSGGQPRRTWGQAHELCSDRALRRPAVARCAAPPGAAPMPFPAFRCLHPKRAVALLGHAPSQVKVYSSRRQKSHMQRQWARLARRGWCAGVVPTAPRSLERIRREMRQAEPPARGGAAQASLGL